MVLAGLSPAPATGRERRVPTRDGQMGGAAVHHFAMCHQAAYESLAQDLQARKADLLGQQPASRTADETDRSCRGYADGTVDDGTLTLVLVR
ncbi:hypothetical protein L13192_00076 [Pyrenophora tritici-repentis]|uniref:Uncharacterized protein n=1 Tax=Pyrenophora tritici-repentis TaxID=45151 RepID=A0A922NM25_9PLEO|nr:hypothetical protein Ptr86124_002823 [Pyrenophora tritici-repentis]KAI1673329.1 hypothetical protein L13192_00076 [Pyrenophora tritici-repentis]KAI1689653.1 hypothetical protein KJE20_02831 [Pyrenophora tritici-repentis]